jgi:hypothetical protein
MLQCIFNHPHELLLASPQKCHRHHFPQLLLHPRRSVAWAFDDLDSSSFAWWNLVERLESGLGIRPSRDGVRASAHEAVVRVVGTARAGSTCAVWPTCSSLNPLPTHGLRITSLWALAMLIVSYLAPAQISVSLPTSLPKRGMV